MSHVIPRGYWPAFILLTSCFALWGLANNLTDVLLATFKRVMSMSDFQTSWIQVAFYGSYFCLALPAAAFIRRFSYKSGVLLGLGLFAAGALLFYPASLTMQYGHFLVALFVLAGGLSILETSANPYVVALGPEESATRRLNLAQAFNPIGAISGVLIGKIFILSHLNPATDDERVAMPATQLQQIQQAELNAVMGPYVTIAIVILGVWLAILLTRFPTARDAQTVGRLRDGLVRLMKTRRYVMGVTAQFFYVGVQIGVWSFTIRYVMANLGHNEADASNYYLASIILFSVSRFACTALMWVVPPALLLAGASVLGAALCAVVMLAGGMTGVIALVGISACMSLMFPTIYGLSVQGLGHDTKLGASGLIMAILGGAVLTAVQGRVSDVFGIGTSFLIPAVGFGVILLFALYCTRRSNPPDAFAEAGASADGGGTRVSLLS